MFLSHLAQPEADPDPGQLSAAAPRCCSQAASKLLQSCFKAAPKLHGKVTSRHPALALTA